MILFTISLVFGLSFILKNSRINRRKVCQPMEQERVVALIDMDCFYVQVEQRDRPELWGKPTAVVQYNQWKGGGYLYSVSYEARDRGVLRGSMRGEDAQKVCPEINLVQVPVSRGKADLTKYRNASAEVFAVLNQFSNCIVERASVDEAFIDLTDLVESKLRDDLGSIEISKLPTTFVVVAGKCKQTKEERQELLEKFLETVSDRDRKLAIAAMFIEEMRAEVLKQTQFRCSAGISTNKILAKLACALHKPRQQTILPQSSVADLYEITPIRKVRNFGGKLGKDITDHFHIERMAELAQISPNELLEYFGEKTGAWVAKVAQGFDAEPVIVRDLVKSVGCSKNFMGKAALATRQDVLFWLTQLSEEFL